MALTWVCIDVSDKSGKYKMKVHAENETVV